MRVVMVVTPVEVCVFVIPTLNRSFAMISKTEVDHGKQVTEARRDCDQVI